MIIRKNYPFKDGYNSITEINGKHSEMMLDFGLYEMKQGMRYTCNLPKERAFMLMNGSIAYRWSGLTEKATRNSLLDENPWVLHVPKEREVEIACVSETAEICVERVINDEDFEAVFYKPNDIRSDVFGKGTMQGTSTRTVRTVFDALNAPYSEMVLGEVINHPGKWSSYPPHDHPQPEIYHYRLFPVQGFGIATLEDEAWIVHNGDTEIITPNNVHAQTAAPGYAMYYIWILPHLEKEKFVPESRRFRREHAWLLEKNTVIWPDKNQ